MSKAMPLSDEMLQRVPERIAELERQIEPLVAEHARLVRIRDALAAADLAAVADGPEGPKVRGKKAAAVVALIQRHPGLQASEIARRAGLDRSYIYRVLSRLEERGTVERRDYAYFPVAGADAQ